MADMAREQQADARARLLEHFAGDVAQHQDRWSNLWDQGDFLPWDRGAPNPALVDLLSDRQDLIGPSTADNHTNEQGGRRRKKALVPGCGRGYDVLLLASFGYDAYGLEVSESAVKMARKEQETNGHKYPASDASVGAGKVLFLKGDFFRDEWAKTIDEEATFDLIYDYTFLSALPPSLRPAWSLRMCQLLRPVPDSNLVCVEFPTYKDPSTGGPPFGLPPEVYLAHLSRPGEAVPYDETGHLVEIAVDEKRHAAFERIAHWQPERTHEIGKGTDWISVWRQKHPNRKG